MRQRLRAALTYPVILISASLAVILFLLTFVVPTFSRIYGDMDAELPAATRVLVTITAYLQEALPVVFVGIGVAGLALWRWRRTPQGRRLTDRWIVRLPWVGGLTSGYLYSRFARTLAMMQAGGIPMMPSLETTLGTISNSHLADGLRSALPRVAAGGSLADSLGKTGMVPSLILELVAVGEDLVVNELLDTLQDVAGRNASVMSGRVSIASLMMFQSLPPRTPSLLLDGLPWQPWHHCVYFCCPVCARVPRAPAPPGRRAVER